ncbi:MAG: enoyl-CoA hydratase-related protein, partial [Chloroflexi bacterium]|nr:enoyl-CoA hydratase-related protein [Chloroflexota bacterium]
MDYKNIIVEKLGNIGKLSINRPDVRNALNKDTRLEIEQGIQELSVDNNIKVVVVTGAGDKAFCAGADIRDMKDATPLEAIESAELGKRVFNKIESLEKPVIAMINGFALGGGCELALACDIRIASDKAKLGQPEINLGFIPGYAGTQRLPRLVGKAVAKELIMIGDLIDANEAYRIGLVNKVVPADKLESTVMDMAKKLASRSPIA